jgi:hypothetical protein
MYILHFTNLFSDWSEKQMINLSTRKRSLKRPAALRDYVTEDKDANAKYETYEEDDENEDYLVGKVQKAYQNLKRIQTVKYTKILITVQIHIAYNGDNILTEMHNVRIL